MIKEGWHPNEFLEIFENIAWNKMKIYSIIINHCCFVKTTRVHWIFNNVKQDVKNVLKNVIYIDSPTHFFFITPLPMSRYFKLYSHFSSKLMISRDP